MFGYISINKPEMKVKEFDTYQSFYCGLCHSLRRTSGIPGQLTLTYDMTFLSLLLTALYEEKPVCRMERCPVRPWRKMRKLSGPLSDYAASMNVILAYYNLEDDWLDDRSLKSWLLSRLLCRKVRKLKKQYPRQTKAVRNYLDRLHQCESERSANLDLAAGLTGEMLGEIFVYQEDIWAEDLRRIGFFLGKYIYLMDAMEDREKDAQSGSYNPWNEAKEDILKLCPKDVAPDTFLQDYILQVLTMMMAETTIAFERLPILEYSEILRNILYSGVWTKYEAVLSGDSKRKKKG